MNEPVHLVTGKPDSERAAEFKKLVESKLIEICAILDDAERDGFKIGFGTGKGPIGRWIITALEVVKPFP